jgi:hypothetical protein
MTVNGHRREERLLPLLFRWAVDRFRIAYHARRGRMLGPATTHAKILDRVVLLMLQKMPPSLLDRLPLELTTSGRFPVRLRLPLGRRGTG